MRWEFRLAGGVFLAGLLVGVGLWLSGVDVALQKALMEGYHPRFNEVTRVLGTLGLGRTLVWGCLIGGLTVEGGRWRGNGERRQGLGKWVFGRLWGVVEQVWLWARGKWVWARCWEGAPLTSKVLLSGVVVLGFAGIAQLLAKWAIGRPRPKEIFWNGMDPFDWRPFGFDAGWWSMPSGHTVSVFVLAVWLGLWFPKWRWPLLALAAVLGGARFLAVTPHYLGDVVVGAGLGSAVALVVFGLMKKGSEERGGAVAR